MGGAPTSTRPKGLPGAAFLLSVFGLLVSIDAQAAPLRISWASGTEADLSGYRLKYGTSPGEYAQNVDVGLTTSYEPLDLELDRTYYFAVFAYDMSGNESPPSPEVTVKLPATGAPIPSLTTARELYTQSIYALRGRSAVFVVYGDNFVPGATVALGPGIVPGVPVQNSLGNLWLMANVSAQAELGQRTVTVTNSDGGIGSRSHALVVVNSPDTNADCLVDVVDLNALARAWNESNGESRYSATVDFDGDGYVGPDDLAVFVQYYLRVLPGCP